MSPQDFCYWLQGFFELGANDTISKEQVAMIKEHLQLVFKKVTGKEEPKLKPLDEDLVRKMIEEAAKNPPPFRPFWDWELPTIYCSSGTSGLQVECMDTSKTSDANLDIGKDW